MKNPLWIINSTFAVLLCLLFILMAVMKSPMPKRESLLPQNIAPLQKAVSGINPVRIYESDLFRTYVKPVLPEQPTQEQVIAPPLPPQPKVFTKKPKGTPEFLPPLDIELKGVIFNSNGLYSRAIIMNRKTKTEELYKVGDSVEDAHLIYIGKNKAMFIRSNGQQETLFVTAEDAQKDSIYAPYLMSNAVERLDETHYVVNADQIAKEINNLAHFFELLDVTTAFKKGQTIGCHIGKINPKSLGATLGLRYGDIITAVNDIPTTTTSERVKIYKTLEKAENGYQINVSMLRNERPITLQYTLQKRISKQEAEKKHHRLPAPAGTPLNVDAVRENKKISQVSQQTLGQVPHNNAIADTFKKNDRKSMVEYGGRNALLQR